MSKTGVLAEPPLIGREKELEELGSFLNSAVEGKGKTVFVSGEAGSGKTRLLTEFLSRAKKHGAITILRGWCLGNAAVPYFPFFEAFNAYFTQELTEETEGLLGVTDWLKGPSQAEKAGKYQVFSPQVWKDQTFAAVARTLINVVAKGPVILFIDDVHWADSASLSLIHYIARVISSEKVLFLATFRSEQLGADAEGRPNPLVETLRLMRREDLLQEIKLVNLNVADVSSLAQSMLGGELQKELTEKLAAESQGNALFVVESLRMLSERNGLVREHEKWRLSGDELGIPDKIKDIILQRLSVLHHDQRRILDAASVIGEKFDAETLGAVLGQDCLEIADSLDLIGQATSLVRNEGDDYCFDHARTRDAIYDGLSVPLKRRYHAKVAEKLESYCKSGQLPLSELSHHYVQAGNVQKAVEYALAAGKDELEKWSNEQAIRHFSYALQNVPDGHTEEKREALEGLGDAYAANSMYEDAIKTFEALAAFETGVVRLRALRKASDAAFHKMDKPDLLLEYANRAEEYADYDRLEMARILSNRGRAFGWAGRGHPKEDLADYDAALRIFEEENSYQDIAEALWRSGVAGCTVGYPEEGLSKMLRSIAIFKDLGDTRKELEATVYTGSTLLTSGLFPEAEREFFRVLRTGEKLGIFSLLAVASNSLSRLKEHEWKLDEALSIALNESEFYKKTDTTFYINDCLVRVYSKLGDLKRAGEHFEKMEKVPPEILLIHWVRVRIDNARAIHLAAKGQWKESNQIFEKLLNPSPPGMPPKSMGGEVFSRVDYAWALEKQGRVEEAKRQRDAALILLEKVETKWGNANVQLSVLMPRKVQVGEVFEMRIDLVNVGRKPGFPLEIVKLFPPEFEIANSQFSDIQQNGVLDMKKKRVDPFEVLTIKFELKAHKAGNYDLTPELTCVDDRGLTKKFKAKHISVAVRTPEPTYETLPGRIRTGYSELDRLLLGGIPENYAMVLVASSCEERELLLTRFLTVGADAGETTFLVTADVNAAKDLAEHYPTNFYVVVCNLQADSIPQNLHNVIKLKGIESLSELDIALTKAFRMINQSYRGPKRICLELVSDVLLQHHALITRKWLNALLPKLKAQGFTILAVMNPHMHTNEEVEAILGLFQGEIDIFERDTPKGLQQILRIRKLYHQKYEENELIIDRTRLKLKH